MPLEADTTTSTPTSEELGGRARSLANLRPPWRPGASGNPSGLTKDGKPPKVAKLEASLLAKLAKPGRMDRLAGAWIKAALKGSAPHLSMILERLYPVPQDALAGKTVLEGLRLELSPGKATLTVARGEALQASGEAHVTGSSEGMTVTGGDEGAQGEGDALGSE